MTLNKINYDTLLSIRTMLLADHKCGTTICVRKKAQFVVLDINSTIFKFSLKSLVTRKNIDIVSNYSWIYPALNL